MSKGIDPVARYRRGDDFSPQTTVTPSPRLPLEGVAVCDGVRWRGLVLKAADEQSFQASVLEVARLAGWRSLHIRPARRADGSWRTPIGGDGKGWPDLVLVRPPRLLFVELKSASGKLRPEQLVWLDTLRLLPGAEVYLWRPNDWDAVVEVLTGTERSKAA